MNQLLKSWLSSFSACLKKPPCVIWTSAHASREAAQFLLPSLSVSTGPSTSRVCALVTFNMKHLNMGMLIPIQWGWRVMYWDLWSFIIYQVTVVTVVFSPRSYKLRVTLVYFDTKKKKKIPWKTKKQESKATNKWDSQANTFTKCPLYNFNTPGKCGIGFRERETFLTATYPWAWG